jgi:hypothetical protein
MNTDKPMHFDGSSLNQGGYSEDTGHESFILTDEMRPNTSGNPYLNQGE